MPSAPSVWLGSLTVFALLLGCETVQVVDPEVIARHEGFIVDGKTRRKEVLERFGPPQSTYENGALLVYHVQLDDVGRIRLLRDKRLPCSAYVLAFDPQDVLERHSLVRYGCR